MSQPEFQDIVYRKQDGIATVCINRPQVYNAFRPLTLDEILAAFEDAWYDETVGVIVLTGAGGNFCTGGDQKIRGDQGYVDHRGEVPRLQGRHLHRMIREVPKPVIAAVDGWCVGGGHVLQFTYTLLMIVDWLVVAQAGGAPLRDTPPTGAVVVGGGAGAAGLGRGGRRAGHARPRGAGEAREPGLPRRGRPGERSCGAQGPQGDGRPSPRL